jgi:hypothetical protein
LSASRLRGPHSRGEGSRRAGSAGDSWDGR